MRIFMSILLMTAMVFAICGEAMANTPNSIYQEFKHSRGPFTSSKEYTHSIIMPANMKSQGYSFYSRQVHTTGKCVIKNERLLPYEYHFTFKLDKSFLTSESGQANVTLWARPGGYTGVQQPTNGGIITGADPNAIANFQPPTLLSPVQGSVFNIPQIDRIRFSWRPNGSKYQLKVYNMQGKDILSKETSDAYYDWMTDHKTIFGKIFLPEVKTGDLRWQVRAKINGNWTAYASPVTFQVINTYYNQYPNYPNQPGYPTYPGTSQGGPIVLTYPTNGAQAYANNLNFTWSGGYAPFNFRLMTQQGQIIVNQTVNNNNYVYNGAVLQAGIQYMWAVSDRQNTNMSPYYFTVLSGYNNYPNQPGYPDYGYGQTGGGAFYAAGQQVQMTLDANQQLASVIVNARLANTNASEKTNIAVYIENTLIGNKSVTNGALTFNANGTQGRQLFVKVLKGGCYIDSVYPAYANGTGYANQPGYTYPNQPGYSYPNQPGYTTPNQPTTPPTNTINPPTPVGPANGSQMDLRPVMLQWEGTGQVYQLTVNSPQTGVIVNQQVNTNSYTIPANLLKEGLTFTWQVRQQVSGQWSQYGRSYIFKIKGTAASNRAGYERVAQAILENDDLDVAESRLSTIEMDSEYGQQARVMLAATYEDKGDYTRAIAVYNDIIKADKKSEALMLSKIANCYAEMGNASMAKATLQRLISKYPKSVQAAEAKNLLLSIDGELGELDPLKK